MYNILSLPYCFIATLVLAYLLFSNMLSRVCFCISAYLTLLVISDTFDLWAWLFAYELSILCVISPFTTEGRSYRKTYALLILLGMSFVSTTLFVKVLQSQTLMTNILNNQFTMYLDSLFILVALLIKTPVYPFSVWLPEAHVEASFSGSIVLAGYALKFSLFALIVFASTIIQRSDLIMILVCLGGLSGSFSAVSTPDFKKFAANMSVTHMSLTVLLFSIQSQVVLKLSLLTWSHHSLIASWLFFMIGCTYAVTGTRNIRHISQGFTIAPLWTCTVFLILTFSMDMPWSATTITEISLLATLNNELLTFGFFIVLIIIFTGTIHAIGKLYIHREFKPVMISYDLPVSYILCLNTCCIFTLIYVNI